MEFILIACFLGSLCWHLVFDDCLAVNRRDEWRREREKQFAKIKSHTHPRSARKRQKTRCGTIRTDQREHSEVTVYRPVWGFMLLLRWWSSGLGFRVLRSSIK
jgi:hypothetical protein